VRRLKLNESERIFNVVTCNGSPAAEIACEINQPLYKAQLAQIPLICSQELCHRTSSILFSHAETLARTESRSRLTVELSGAHADV